MHWIWKLMFPLAMPFWTFAEDNDDGGDGNGNGDDDGDDDGNGNGNGDDDGNGNGDDADAVKAELAKARTALKKANAESKDRRLKLKKFEEEEDKRKKAAMGDLEKAQTDLAETITERDQLRVTMADLRIRHAIEIGAAGLKFVDPGDAFNLIDMGEIEIDEDTGEVSGVDKALKALVKAKPYLITSEEDDSPGTPSSKRKLKKPTKDALPERSMAPL